MRRYFLSFALFLGAGFAQTPAMPKAELLWPAGAPGAQGTEDIDKPSLAPYLVPAGRGTGTAVIVCPGGGYSGLSMDKEGDQIARWLNSLGVTAFVLKYRLGPKYHHPVELGDAQRAIRTVRSKAAASPASKCVPAVDARCPPAENPMIPMRSGSKRYSDAWERTVRMARCASPSSTGW